MKNKQFFLDSVAESIFESLGSKISESIVSRVETEIVSLEYKDTKTKDRNFFKK